MLVIQEIMVREIDQEREGSGLERSDFARKLLAQGLMVERQLKDPDKLKNLLDGSPKDSAAPKTSRKKPKAQRPTTSKQISGAEVAALCDDEAPSSPSEELSDTVPPSAPIESEEPTEDLLEAVLSQADHICPNPFGDCPECEEAS